MTNVQVYLSDIYLTGSLREFVQTVRARAFFAASEQQGSDIGAATFLEWPAEECARLTQEPAADSGSGPLIASIPLADIPRLSFFLFGKCAERIAVAAVDHLGSNYGLVRFFSVSEECVIRRIKSSARTSPWVNKWFIRSASN